MGMKIASALLSLVSLAAQLPAQDLPTWYFPALTYGANRWSLVKVTNNSTKPREIRLDVYDQQGQPMPVTGSMVLQPGEAHEVRIEKQIAGTGLAWARILALQPKKKELKVEVSSERLVGNAIDHLDRHDEQLSLFAEWYTAPGPYRYIYMANVGEHRVDITLCWADRPKKDPCSERSAVDQAKHIGLEPKKTLYAQLGKQRGRYLIVIQRSTSPESVAMLSTFLGPANAKRREFSTDSTLTFDDVETSDDTPNSTMKK